MEAEVILAKGGPWTKTRVAEKLIHLGIPADSLEDQFYRIEQEFILLLQVHNSRAEWSIRFGEVTGQPEDLQFDIDGIKDDAILTIVANYTDDYSI